MRQPFLSFPVWLGGVILLCFLGGCEPEGHDARPVPASMHALIPIPAEVTLSLSERFMVTAETPILVDPGNTEAHRIGNMLAALIGNTEETTPAVRYHSGEPTGDHILLTTADADSAWGEEGYALTIASDQITIRAVTAAGLFYGVQTLRQLLPPAVEYRAAFEQPLPVPVGEIIDAPRYVWRGAMLDVSRHFFPIEAVKRYIDWLALYKMNRLHLHLSDDQGWRIEIPSWPDLTAIGGSTQVGGGPGGYYTQEGFAELVRYASDRFITIVPEIDLPGHTNAALASYPGLNCEGVAPSLYTGTEVGFSSLCVDKEITYQFVEEVVREIATVSSGPYFHIGGDEVEKLSHDEYEQFMVRVQEIVAMQGKQVVGWDEIAEISLLPGTIVQHWRPSGAEDAIAQAVEQGAVVVLSPANKAYLDMKYDSGTVLGLNWAGYLPVEDSYSWTPETMVSGVSDEAIIGVEAPLWSETLGTLDDVAYMAFPRIAGIAEIGWSPAEKRSWAEYRLRLGAQEARWTALGINFYRAPEVPWAANW